MAPFLLFLLASIANFNLPSNLHLMDASKIKTSFFSFKMSVLNFC